MSVSVMHETGKVPVYSISFTSVICDIYVSILRRSRVTIQPTVKSESAISQAGVSDEPVFGNEATARTSTDADDVVSVAAGGVVANIVVVGATISSGVEVGVLGFSVHTAYNVRSVANP